MSHETTQLSRHRTVLVELGERREDIDEQLAPLILEIWKAGIETIMSCQETGFGPAWIEFESADDALQFLDIVTRYEAGADTLYNRICYNLTDPMSFPEWEYRFHVMDVLEDQPEQKMYGIASFHATIGIYFPQVDIAVLLDRLRDFNESSHADADS